MHWRYWTGFEYSIFIHEKINGNVRIFDAWDDGGTVIQLQLPLIKCTKQQNKIDENFPDIIIDIDDMTVKKVLIIEDDIFQQNIWKELLKTNYEIEANYADDGYEALKLIEKYEFDTFIIDMNMPIIDGEELLNRIKHIKCRKIIYTADYNKESEMRLKEEQDIDVVWNKLNGFEELIKYI